MKSKALIFSLAIAILWAALSTFLYLQLKNNPRVVSATTGLTLPANQESLQLAELEKINFLRQYLERYFNYESNSFWQTQTSLSTLMDSGLRDARLVDVRRFRDKIQSKNLVQKGQILSLASNSRNTFEVVVNQQIFEDQNKTSDLNINLTIEITDTDRTLENPWGFLVKKMDFTKSGTEQAPFKSTLLISDKTPLIITFPCAVQNIESDNESALKTKITTFNISEVQITNSQQLTTPVQLKALCKNVEFKFQIEGSTQEHDLFRAFPEISGVVRKKELLPPPPHKKTPYEESLEKAWRTKSSN